MTRMEGGFDPQAIIADQEARLQEARELAKELTTIQKDRGQLDDREAQIRDRFASLGVAVPGRRGNKSRRGRTQAQRRQPRRARMNGHARSRGRHVSGEFPNLVELLVHKVLSEKPMNLDEIKDAALKAGWKTNTDRPKVVILQALRGPKAKGRVDTSQRGLYALTKKGVKSSHEEVIEPKAEAVKA
jgi:hypothetical protein